MANTGIKTVLTLRKYVNGIATDEIKTNSPSDPDYIAPYEDLVDCPIGSEPTTTTSTTTTTTAAPTTTTTTAQQNFESQSIPANCSSSTGGTIVDGGTTYQVNATRTFIVPTTGNFDIILTATFNYGLSSVSCYSRVYKSGDSISYTQEVSVSSGTPTATNSDLGVSLTAGTYTMIIYGAECDSSFGSFNLTVTEA